MLINELNVLIKNKVLNKMNMNEMMMFENYCDYKKLNCKIKRNFKVNLTL